VEPCKPAQPDIESNALILAAAATAATAAAAAAAALPPQNIFEGISLPTVADEVSCTFSEAEGHALVLGTTRVCHSNSTGCYKAAQQVVSIADRRKVPQSIHCGVG
jgi:hypothetical protein